MHSMIVFLLIDVSDDIPMYCATSMEVGAGKSLFIACAICIRYGTCTYNLVRVCCRLHSFHSILSPFVWHESSKAY